MKKSVLTFSFLALFAVAANAQTKATSKPAAKEQTTIVNDDGTISEKPAEDTKPVENTEKKDQPKKSGTRMAINQKGTPTSKSKNTKEETKKADNPGQPVNRKD